MASSRKPVGVAVIGAGNFARRQHLPNIHRTPEARLIAVCDIDEENAQREAKRYEALYAETDYRRLFEDGRIEAVVIAVRDDLQARIAVRALEMGRHVYVEKPLAADPDICAEVGEAQAKSGKRLAVGFNKRFAPIYRKAREVMAADGGPKNLHMRMADDAWRWAVGYPPGHLLSLDVCHFFDLLRWFTGSEVSSVYCIASRPEDYCLAVSVEDGTVASVLFSGHGTMDMPKERIDAVCSRGGISAVDFVELRTYGYRDYDPVYTFAGHSHPDGEFGHMLLLEKLGAQGFAALRRGAWELREDLYPVGRPDSPYRGEARRYADRTIPNFLRDQGWLASLRAFLCGILTGSGTDHAAAADAVAASRATAAAVRSLTSGRPEPL